MAERALIWPGLWLVLFCWGAGAACAAGPPKVASVSLCGDQYLMMLADPGQVVSLSHQSMSPLSYVKERAASFPRNRGSVEELILSDVELVVLNAYGDTQLKRILRKFGIDYFELPLGETIGDVEETVIALSQKLGREAEGHRLVGRMKKRVEAVSRSAQGGAQPVALYFRSDGGGAGAGTFVDDAIRAAGFRNLQRDLGKKGWGTLPLEQAVMTPPDVFVTSFFDTPYQSVRGLFRYNPVFWELAQKGTLVQVPGKLWPCSSPLLVNAVEFLARAHRETGSNDREMSRDGG
ncbi:iron complex transport system substrate-binding protein [Parvibaculum indicum]|uniref:ABC transporter substrate-binding protein n=1 Tax=Parvibaculum indicum TaxID=562969 RepID=UPI00141D844E|nr:iron complex transport system substrate-binding protein [Parvibaculum indicum]